MPNIKSQKKRVLISLEEKAQNNSKKSRIKNAIKKYEAVIAEKDAAKAAAMLPELFSLLDSAKSDGVYHINTVSRKKAQLAKALDSIKA